MKKIQLAGFTALLSCSLFGTAVASPTKQIYVPKYFVQLARDTSVPADILYALTVKESNTKMNNKTMAPWPFTINFRGKGYTYASYAEMITAARRLVKEGHTSFDIGAFQVNWKWNGHLANSLEELGEPYQNGIVAAKIIKGHYEKYGNWCTAAGRYHNPANKAGLADSYAADYCEILRSIQTGHYQRHLVSKTQTYATSTRK